ncbi:MAG: hypothetical protein ABL973_12020 [Micropepsaceae bacterium]
MKRGARRLRALVRRCCFWITVLTLAACTTFEVTPFLKEQITGDTWRACLAREYQSQARFQLRYGRHWQEATYLADLGQKSLDSTEAHHTNTSLVLDPKYRELTAALKSQGKTCTCAQAQARLDGWSVALAQDPDRDQSAFATSFDAAMVECVNQH